MSTSDSSPTPPWRQVDPPELGTPVGYSNAIVTQGGTRVFLAGQTAMNAEGRIEDPGDLLTQTGKALANVATVLKAAGAEPEHLTRMRIYVLSADEYANHARAIGKLYREHFGRWFPAMTLVQVARLYDPDALIEIETEAVIP